VYDKTIKKDLRYSSFLNETKNTFIFLHLLLPKSQAMTFYGYILASAYKFYVVRFNGGRRTLAYSFLFTGICQLLLLFSLLAILKKGVGIWGVIALLAFILPIAVMAILLP